MNRSLTSGLIAIFLILATHPSYAAPPKEDVTAKTHGRIAALTNSYTTMDLAPLKELAAHGDSLAQSVLGFRFNNGIGAPQNYTEGYKWHRLSAAQGHAGSQSVLGVMYVAGRGIPMNYVRGLMWLNLSWSAMSSDEKKVASGTSDIAKLIIKKMTPAQIAEAQAMARKCQASNFKQCD